MTSTSTDRVQLGHSNEFYIDGMWVQPSSSATIDVINPTTEQIDSRCQLPKRLTWTRPLVPLAKHSTVVRGPG